MKFKFFSLGFGLAIVIFAVLLGGFTLGKNTSKQAPTPTPEQSSVPTVTLTPTPTPLNPKEVISSAFEADDFAIITPILQKSVLIRIERSDCCGVVDASEVVGNMKYLKDAKSPWDFNPEGDVQKSLVATYPQYYTNALIGVAENNFVVAFQFDETGKVKSISMTNNYHIIVD